MTSVERPQIHVRVNGVLREVTTGMTVADLVGASSAGVAVARDREVVPRSQWSATRLADGDDVEIVRAVQGG